MLRKCCIHFWLAKDSSANKHVQNHVIPRGNRSHLQTRRSIWIYSWLCWSPHERLSRFRFLFFSLRIPQKDSQSSRERKIVLRRARLQWDETLLHWSKPGHVEISLWRDSRLPHLVCLLPIRYSKIKNAVTYWRRPSSLAQSRYRYHLITGFKEIVSWYSCIDDPCISFECF